MWLSWEIPSPPIISGDFILAHMSVLVADGQSARQHFNIYHDFFGGSEYYSWKRTFLAMASLHAKLILGNSFYCFGHCISMCVHACQCLYVNNCRLPESCLKGEAYYIIKVCSYRVHSVCHAHAGKPTLYTCLTQ